MVNKSRIQIGWTVEHVLAFGHFKESLYKLVVTLFHEIIKVLRYYSLVRVHHELSMEPKHVKGLFWEAQLKSSEQVGIGLALLEDISMADDVAVRVKHGFNIVLGMHFIYHFFEQCRPKSDRLVFLSLFLFHLIFKELI